MFAKMQMPKIDLLSKSVYKDSPNFIKHTHTHPDMETALSQADTRNDGDQAAELIEILPPGLTLTENGAVQCTLDAAPCLELFFTADPHISPYHLDLLLGPAWASDPKKTLQIIFNLGNCRKGQGGKMQHRTFLLALLWLFKKSPETVLLNLEEIVEQGCYKDLLELVKAVCFDDGAGIQMMGVKRKKPIIQCDACKSSAATATSSSAATATSSSAAAATSSSAAAAPAAATAAAAAAPAAPCNECRKARGVKNSIARTIRERRQIELKERFALSMGARGVYEICLPYPFSGMGLDQAPKWEWHMEFGEDELAYEELELAYEVDPLSEEEESVGIEQLENDRHKEEQKKEDAEEREKRHEERRRLFTQSLKTWRRTAKEEWVAKMGPRKDWSRKWNYVCFLPFGDLSAAEVKSRFQEFAMKEEQERREAAEKKRREKEVSSRGLDSVQKLNLTHVCFRTWSWRIWPS